MNLWLFRHHLPASPSDHAVYNLGWSNLPTPNHALMRQLIRQSGINIPVNPSPLGPPLILQQFTCLIHRATSAWHYTYPRVKFPWRTLGFLWIFTELCNVISMLTTYSCQGMKQGEINISCIPVIYILPALKYYVSRIKRYFILFSIFTLRVKNSENRAPSNGNVRWQPYQYFRNHLVFWKESWPQLLLPSCQENNYIIVLLAFMVIPL